MVPSTDLNTCLWPHRDSQHLFIGGASSLMWYSACRQLLGQERWRLPRAARPCQSWR